MIRSERRSWLPVAFWGAVAIASLAAATWVALRPENLRDLHEVRSWLAYARAHSANPYSYFEHQLDYPPIAFFVLAPIGWIPETRLVWFLPLSILAAALAGWVLTRAIAERLGTRIPVPHRLGLVLLLLSGSHVRGAIWTGQTVAFAVLLGSLALLWSRRRPFAAAFALALCSYKPHLAAGFGLAILLLDGLDVPLIAGAIMSSITLLVSAALNQSIIAVVAGYVRNVFTMYDGPGHIRGILGLRWVFEDLIGHYGLAAIVYGVAATAALVLIARMARIAADDVARVRVAVAALMWPLLFLPSQLYNGIMAAPALWLLMWPESDLIRRESRRLLAVGAFVIFGVLDVPRILRLLSAQLADGYWLYKGSYYLSPLRLVLVFGFILLISIRRSSAPHSEDSPA